MTKLVVKTALAQPGAALVPSLFRLTLIGAAKRREPTSGETPAQRHHRRYRDHRRKFELYFDVTARSRWTDLSATPVLPLS